MKPIQWIKTLFTKVENKSISDVKRLEKELELIETNILDIERNIDIGTHIASELYRRKYFISSELFIAKSNVENLNIKNSLPKQVKEVSNVFGLYKKVYKIEDIKDKTKDI